MASVEPIVPVAEKNEKETFKENLNAFLAKIGPGGVYFRYSLGLVIFLGLVLIVLVTLILLPYLGGVKYQNPVSQSLGIAPIAQPQPKASPVPVPTATPIPLRPDASGRGVYSVSQGKHAGPSAGQVTFDPLDAKKDQTLTITVLVSDTAPITSVKAILNEDNSSQNISFSLTSGTNLDGHWTGKIMLNSSVLYTYALTITSESANGSAQIEVTPR